MRRSNNRSPLISKKEETQKQKGKTFWWFDDEANYQAFYPA